VLKQPLGSLDAVRASKPKRLPTVLSKDEVRRLIAALPSNASHRLIVELLYGTGMRISECCKIRVIDLDFDHGQIIIRGGKGNKDRVTMLPQSLEERLNAQVEFVRLRHEHDVEHGAGYAPVPTSLEHKRHGAARDLRWQFVFGSAVIRLDKDTGRRIRCRESRDAGVIEKWRGLDSDLRPRCFGVRLLVARHPGETQLALQRSQF